MQTSQFRRNKFARGVVKSEISSVENPTGNLGAVPQPLQSLKEKHHRPGTMICRHGRHLQEIDLIPVIGVKSVGFIVVEDMYCSDRNPVLLQHEVLGYFRTIELVIDFRAIGLLPEEHGKCIDPNHVVSVAVGEEELVCCYNSALTLNTVKPITANPW